MMQNLEKVAVNSNNHIAGMRILLKATLLMGEDKETHCLVALQKAIMEHEWDPAIHGNDYVVAMLAFAQSGTMFTCEAE